MMKDDVLVDSLSNSNIVETECLYFLHNSLQTFFSLINIFKFWYLGGLYVLVFQ